MPNQDSQNSSARGRGSKEESRLSSMLRTSENSVKAKFAECTLRTRVNKGQRYAILTMCYIVLGPYDVLVYTGEPPFRGSGKEELGVGTIAEPRTQKEADLLRPLYHSTTIPKQPGGQVYLQAELRRIPILRPRVNNGYVSRGRSLRVACIPSELYAA